MTNKIICGVCGAVSGENLGAGWPGWGRLSGIALDGENNPFLCPKHLAAVADFIDALPKQNEGVSDGVD